MIENDVCILIVIMSLYSQNNYKVNEFLGKVEAKKEYNKHFSLKIFKSSATTKQKIKLLLFRINKHVFLGSIKTYLFIKRKVLRKY